MSASDDRNELGATEIVMDLLFSALDHATESVAYREDLVPFCLAILRRGERRLDRFAFDSIDAGRAAMISHAQSLSEERIA